MKRPTKLSLLAFALGLVPAVGTAQNKVQIEITFTNTAPSGGLWLMRPWIGLHDGKLTTFTVGEAANSGIQHIAEDGATGDPTDLLPPSNACSGLSSVYSSSAPCQFEIFNNYANHGQQATIGNPTRPGATISATFSVDPNDPDSQFLSYLVMMIPSNDAFFGTDTAHPIQLFKNGVFNGGKGPITIPVMFSDILDAGTEVNSETPTDTAFIGQAVNGTGTHPDTNAVVHVHDLFGNGILSASNMFGGTLNKFDQANFQGQVGLITIRQQTAVQISFANTAPTDGLWLMRPWIGLHDGKFSTFTVGEAASSGLQHIAEDGVTGDPANLLPPPNACTGLSSVYTSSSPCQFQIFNAYANHGQQASIGNPTRPGTGVSTAFGVDPNDPNSRFLSYLVMMIPSNDAFFGTDTAHPIQLFKDGMFNAGNGPITIPVMFGDILDAGTEVNSEAPADTAFIAQAVNGTGSHPDSNPVVHVHDPFGNGILTASNMFGGTLNKFDQANFQGQVGKVTIQEETPGISSVVNAASEAGSTVAPGEIVVIRGETIGPNPLASAVLPAKGKLATTLAGTTVTFNGIAAPVLYASSTQTSVQVPYSLAGSTSAKVVVMNGSVTTAAFDIDVAASAPGLFTADYSGSGQVVAFNQDGTVNSPDNPAAKGSVVLLFATGEGMTAPAGQDGLIQDNFLRQPVLPVGMTIGGATADVFYAGSAPGSVAGVMEVEAMIPSGAASGALPVSLTVGSNSSQENATISVK